MGSAFFALRSSIYLNFMKREYLLLFRIVHWSIAIIMLFLGLVIVFDPKE